MTTRTYSKMTRKGQVTIPVAVRKALGLDVGDTVAFVMNDGDVTVEPAGSVTARTAGIFKPKKKGRAPSIREMRRAAEKQAVREGLERSR